MAIQYITACSACHGTGSIIEKPCGDCAGKGNIDREETLEVKIPAGVEEGTVLRIAGKGLPSHDTRGTPGDLLVILHTMPDSRFGRDEADLWHTVKLRLVDAVLGTSLDVPTLNGPVTVKVPPGTQPDSVLRLRGKGLPRFKGRGYGSLLVKLNVQVPEELTAQERELYERLRNLARK